MKLKLASRVFLVLHNPDGLLIDSKSINKGIATVKLLLLKNAMDSRFANILKLTPIVMHPFIFCVKKAMKSRLGNILMLTPIVKHPFNFCVKRP